MGDEEYNQLVSMLGKQMDLVAEQKVMQAEHMERFGCLLGSIEEKLEEINTRQDRLESKQQVLEKELIMAEKIRRSTPPINVECVEARLDAVENNVERFGHRLQRIHEETLLGLKETVLEELLKEIRARERNNEKPRVSQASKKVLENRVQHPVDRRTTPNFPSSER
jgi:hypothetical protein